MEHISKNLKKYSKSKHQLIELDRIRAEIFKTTGINPVSLKIHNKTLIIKVINQYEAVEISNIQLITTNCNKIKVII